MQTIYEHPWYMQQQLLENTTTSESESTPKPQQVSLGQTRTELSTNRKGDIAELYVCMIAQWKGAEVFTNIGCDGKTDLCLLINDQIYQVDVKLAQWCNRAKRWRATKSFKVKPPIYPVIVEPRGDIMDWKIRWKLTTRARGADVYCPPGLENFWDKPSTQVEE